MDRLLVRNLITAILRIIALSLICLNSHTGALYTVSAIILFDIVEKNNSKLYWLEAVAIGLSVATIYIVPENSQHILIALLSCFVLARLLIQRNLSDLNLALTLIYLVGINILAFGFVATELSSSAYLIYPFLTCGIIACQTQGKFLIIGSLLAIAWNAGINLEILKFTLMIAMLIELFSLNKDKWLNMSIIFGVFFSPLHAWSTVAIFLLSISLLNGVNRRAVHIMAAIIALISCLATTDSVYVSGLVVVALVVLLIKHKKQEALYVRS
tara:strand:+ start:3406 stop:4215 length:810 start_codon:yes stop_codon:yes gene_type:complete